MTRQKRTTLGATILVVAVGAIAASMLLQGSEDPTETLSPPILAPVAATQGHDPYPLVEADALGMVRMPLDTFDDYAAHYYTAMYDSQPIEFFVLKSADGVVRAAFNACDVCYRSLKGYSQNGQIMVCNNCGSQFPADQINVVRGGCNPSPLDRTVEGEDLILRAEDIILGAVYF